jgi:hypothetical protein
MSLELHRPHHDLIPSYEWRVKILKSHVFLQDCTVEDFVARRICGAFFREEMLRINLVLLGLMQDVLAVVCMDQRESIPRSVGQKTCPGRKSGTTTTIL